MPRRLNRTTRLSLPPWLLALFVGVFVPSPGGAEAPSSLDRAHQASSSLWSAMITPRYRLRADFEVPTDVVMGFSDAFPDEATALASAIAPSAHVLVLLAEDTEPDVGIEWFTKLPPAVQRNSTLMTASKVDSLWLRDYGPFIATSGKSTRWLDAHYMFERPLDDEVPMWLGEWLDIVPISTATAMDGGAIISDGQGHCISTKDYWTEEQGVEEGEQEVLLHELGCADLLLVPALWQDPTSHVDMFAQFVSEDRILVGQVDPREAEEDAERMDEAAKAIAQWAKADGRDLEIIRVPLPVLGGERYYSYVNLLQLEDRIVVPHYPQIARKREKAIFATLEEAFGRPVVTVNMGEFRGMGGVVHCATFNLRLPHGAPWRE